MKKSWTVGLPSALVLLCGAAGTASAAPVDEFLNQVHADGITSATSDDDLVTVGRGICTMLDTGAGRSDVYRDLYENTRLDDPSFVDAFIDDSVQFLCPWNRQASAPAPPESGDTV
ncbi:hypothetical protein A5672_13400 [Mycobacterium alsense]|uniref:DUF732 domain-containing protein n=1 Tax=Mycobacterium alsense TaxID=324058 RepID=A0ABD6P543_9MYCO|nr:DUF732 domain-containing protein [Mycobacterium alsense]OBG40745.1 hypothetical protein A5672_13400 [Mycobacterium alsense]OBI99762.1 hypothetical protein A5660_02465 [Mycobacterium alsense]